MSVNANVNRQRFAVWKIFRANLDSKDDGELIAENCVVVVDEFNVLCVFDNEEELSSVWDPKIYFPLNEAVSTNKRKIRSARGTHKMGRVVIKGRFGLVPEKITFKMEITEYNKLVQASHSWL